jgi:predicted permease
VPPGVGRSSNSWAQDLRYAVRAIGAARLFSGLAIVSLALGIGANTAIFSFLDAIMLRSLPVARPESLVTLSTVTKESEVHGVSRHDDTFLDPAEGYGDSVFAYPAFERLSADIGMFSDVFGFQNAGNLHVTVGSDADLANTEYVTGNYFTGLGISAAAGRLLQPDDDRPGAPAAIVASHAFARRFFGDADRAPGQQIRLNGQPFVIAGVTPPSFSGTDPGIVPALYVPMHAILLPSTDTVRAGTTSFTDPNFEWVIVMARLRPGVTRAQAQAALAPPFSNWMRTVNTERNRADLPRLLVRDGSAGLNGVRYRYANALVILFAVVILILAIACANIANLLLARATARRREIAVRLSLGAGRFRIIRQLLTESVLISALGGVLGTLLAIWGIRALTLLLASGREDFTLRPDVNWRVLAATAGLSLLTGILFGLAPALHATRGNLVPGLKEPRTGRTGRSVKLSRALMAGQFALGLAILVAAGLFVQTLAHLEAVPLGFNPENVLTFRVDASQAGHPTADVPAFYNRLRTRLAAVPGVRGASLSELALLDGRTATGVSAAGKSQASLIFGVGAGFHSTMQVPMLSGREIGERDVTGPPRTAVVNQAFVDKFFNGKNPLGQSVTMRNDCGCTLEIVGVSADVLMGNNVKSRRGPELFYPFHGAAVLEGVTFELRTDGDPMAYASIVRQLVREADPRLPISRVANGTCTHRRYVESRSGICATVYRIRAAGPAHRLRRDCTAPCRTTSRGTRAKSAYGWRWAPLVAASSGWCCGRCSRWRPPAWSLAYRPRSSAPSWSRRSCTRWNHVTRRRCAWPQPHSLTCGSPGRIPAGLAGITHQSDDCAPSRIGRAACSGALLLDPRVAQTRFLHQSFDGRDLDRDECGQILVARFRDEQHVLEPNAEVLVFDPELAAQS